MRTAGPRLRRIFDSSRVPASDVAGRLPGIFEDHNLVGPEDAGFREMARRSRRPRLHGPVRPPDQPRAQQAIHRASPRSPPQPPLLRQLHAVITTGQRCDPVIAARTFAWERRDGLRSGLGEHKAVLLPQLPGPGPITCLLLPLPPQRGYAALRQSKSPA
jgi:hypothetical protein